MKRCVFFDRDGIVNRSPGAGYVEQLGDFELIPEFVDVLRSVSEMRYEAIVVSNQRGVSLGIVGKKELERIHRQLQRTLASHSLCLLDIFYCPHGDGECECRKPKPGMLLRAAGKHGIDLGQSWMVGDSERDVEAGSRAGCRTILVTAEPIDTSADVKVASMSELAKVIGELLDDVAGQGGVSSDVRKRE